MTAQTRALALRPCCTSSLSAVMATAGGLPTGTTEAEIERQFTKYGTLSSVWVARKPAGFGELPEWFCMSSSCLLVFMMST